MLGILQTLAERRDQLYYLCFSVGEAMLGSRPAASSPASAAPAEAERAATTSAAAGAAEADEMAEVQADRTEPPPSPLESAPDDDEDEGEGEGEAALSEEEEEESDGEAGDGGRLKSYGQWQLGRLDAEARQPFAPSVTGYLTQLFCAARFASLSPVLRQEQLAAIATHAMRLELPSWRSDAPPPFIKPPGGRGGEAGTLPTAWRWQAVDTDSGQVRQQLEVEAGPSVPSRCRSGATSPSVIITPGRREPKPGGTPASVVQLELYEEARLHLAALLEQLPDFGGGERAERCMRELEALQGAAGRELQRSLVSAAQLENESAWEKLTRRLLRSKHLQTQVRRVLLKLEEVSKALLERTPGEPFDETHALDVVVDVLQSEAKVVADYLQVSPPPQPRCLAPPTPRCTTPLAPRCTAPFARRRTPPAHIRGR